MCAMRISRIGVLAIFIVTANFWTAADEKPTAWTETQKYVVQRVDPLYPPLAKSVALGGKVIIEVHLDTTGTVRSSKVVSGHPMLTQAAVDAVEQWKFSPRALEMNTRFLVEIAFDSGETKEQHQARLNYFPKAHLCRDLVNRHEAVKAEDICRESLRIAEKMHPNAVLERGSANTWVAHSLFLQRKFAEALPFYETAIRVDEARLEEDDADLASEYANLGRVEFILGRTVDGRAHFERAKTGFQKAIVALPSMKENYSVRFKKFLREFAAVERKLGNSDKAAELDAQAVTVDQPTSDVP
jgi:TonB family protein